MADEEKRDSLQDKPIDILLAEDDPSDVKIILRAFSKAKLKNKVYTVSDGQMALDFVYHKGEYANKEAFPRPDLILLDIKMPKLGGFQVLEKIKENEHYNFIPVIMLTSSKSEEDVARSYRFGACGYIPKPVVFDEFVKVINGFNFYWNIINLLPGEKRGL